MADFIHMKIEGPAVKGSSTVTGFLDQSVIASLHFSGMRHMSMETAGDTRVSADVNFSDINITKEADEASADLKMLCSKGEIIPKVTFQKTRVEQGASDAKIFELVIENVVIGSYSFAGMENESLSLNYTKMQWMYVPQDSAGENVGNVVAGWDLATASGAAA